MTVSLISNDPLDICAQEAIHVPAAFSPTAALSRSRRSDWTLFRQ